MEDGVENSGGGVDIVSNRRDNEGGAKCDTGFTTQFLHLDWYKEETSFERTPKSSERLVFSGTGRSGSRPGRKVKEPGTSERKSV